VWKQEEEQRLEEELQGLHVDELEKTEKHHLHKPSRHSTQTMT
jgi:hypothetical protein